MRFWERSRWRSDELKPGRQKQQAARRPAFAFLQALVLLLFGVLTLQLIRMQIVHGEKYAEEASINILREVQIPSIRGLIYDRNMTPLVQNSATFAVGIVPGDLPKRQKDNVYRVVEQLTGVPLTEIEQKVEQGRARQGPYHPAIIKEGLDTETALKLKEMEPHAPGLKLVAEPGRTYLGGDDLSQTLGYVGPISEEEYEELQDKGYQIQDFIGKNGVEMSYESLLRGRPGKKLIQVDAAGRELRVVSEKAPVDGANLVLTIDSNLQAFAARTLAEAAGPEGAAAAMVMDVRTGEILANVSLPTFDNNLFSRPLTEGELNALVNSPGKPLVHHGLAERYPPGSTFKPVAAAAALQEEVVQPDTVITSRGYITIPNVDDPNVLYVYKDWAALGPLDLTGALAMSSDVYFYYLAGGKIDEGFRGLGEERLGSYARAFGFGQPTGIDLPGESPGLVPSAEWKQKTKRESWSVGDSYDFGIGQGDFLATPVQVLRAISAVANGGDLLKPHLLREVRDGHNNLLQMFSDPERKHVPVDAANLEIVKEGLRQAVTRGTAKLAAVQGVNIGGEIGTSQPYAGSSDTHGWFAGFGPFEDPQIAIVVFIQNSNGEAAAPVASRILDYYFHRPSGNAGR